jgi:hypothetical protein
MTAFADARPCATVDELAAELDNVAPIQVVQLLHADWKAGLVTSSRFLRAALARSIRQQWPDGWWVGEKLDFRRARTFARWSCDAAQEDDTLVERCWRALMQLELPTGWLPDGPDDPILLAAFREAGVEDTAGRQSNN